MKMATSFLAAVLLVGSLAAGGTPASADEAFSKEELAPGSVRQRLSVTLPV